MRMVVVATREVKKKKKTVEGFSMREIGINSRYKQREQETVKDGGGRD